MEQDDAPSSAELSFTWLVAATLHFMCAASTVYLTSDGKTIATVWPANAVLLALLLLYSRPRWITVLSAGLIGNLLANWLTRGTITGPLLLSLANGSEVAVATLLIRGRLNAFDLLRSTGALLRFILAAGVIAPLISGLLGAGAAMLVYQQHFLLAFRTWFVSDSLGLLVFTPVFLSIFNGQLADCLRSKTGLQRVQALGYLGLVAAIAYLVFVVAELPALFLIYAPVILITFRVGPLGTKMAVMMVAVIGALATTAGHGPIAMVATDPQMKAHLFQTFLAVMLLTCLPVAAEISERNRLAQELAARAAEADAEAATDMLTGLFNRRGFMRRFPPLIADWNTGFCCVAVDVDRFKGINDRWGHPFGDRVLRHIASTMRANTRADDLLARLGGDEFLMILHDEPHRTGEEICTRIQSALRQYPLTADDGTSVMVAISVGIICFEGHEPLEQILAQADRALYEAKRDGRNGMRSAAPA